MSIFDFGRRQRLHTQIYGKTSGREMFKVNEYNNIKKLSGFLGLTVFSILTLFYFGWSQIPVKIGLFLGIIMIGCGVWLFYNLKHQWRVRESLYRER